MERLVLATNNQDKVTELRAVLGDHFELLLRPTDLPETIEDGDTLEYNAIKKATEVALHTNELAMADDSGIFVDALGGAPGVFSARYAGENVSYEDNVDKMLKELEGVDPQDRGAQFRTVIALVRPGQPPMTVEGEMKGMIDTKRTGDKGFGYDPIFIPEVSDLSYAAMGAEEKHRISHRTKAVRALTLLLGG